MLEKNIQDILNAGIGLFKAGEANFKTALANVEKTFEELKAKGSTDNSEAAVKIREVLDNTIRSIKDVSERADSTFATVMAEAQKNYTQVLAQLQGVLGEERMRDLNAKMEELTGYIKKTAADLQNQAQSAVGAKPAAAKKPV